MLYIYHRICTCIIKLKSSCCFYDGKRYNFPSCVVLTGRNITKHHLLLPTRYLWMRWYKITSYFFAQNTLGNIFYLFGILMFWISGTAYTPCYELNCWNVLCTMIFFFFFLPENEQECKKLTSCPYPTHFFSALYCPINK